MFIEIVLFALIVQVIGLFSMSMVTGQPLNKTLKDTNMMTVFFCTGVILALLAVYASNYEYTAIAANSGCSRGCGCGCNACRKR